MEMERVQDSAYLERVENSMDLKRVKDSMDTQEDDENSIDSTPLSKKRAPLDVDLNVPVDCGFDLNKFPDEGDETLEEKDIEEVEKVMLKIYLSI